MKKSIIAIASLVFILLLFIMSKYIYYYVQEDRYFSSNYTDYESVVDYIKEIPKLRAIKSKPIAEGINEELGSMKLIIPFNPSIDSIEVKKNDSLLIVGVLNKPLGKTKSLMVIINDNDLSQEIKREVKNINSSIDTTNLFNVYNYIYSHVPEQNLLLDGYGKINLNLRLSHLKSIVTPNGGDKAIYEYSNDKLRAFQFCTPELCRTNFVSLYVRNKDILMTFKNFSQEEIDFVLSSLEWKK